MTIPIIWLFIQQRLRSAHREIGCPHKFGKPALSTREKTMVLRQPCSTSTVNLIRLGNALDDLNQSLCWSQSSNHWIVIGLVLVYHTI